MEKGIRLWFKKRRKGTAEEPRHETRSAVRQEPPSETRDVERQEPPSETRDAVRQEPPSEMFPAAQPETQAVLPAYFKKTFRLHTVNASAYSPLALAYIGDAVYEVMIRTRVVNQGNMQVSKMHHRDAELVKAGTQAKLVNILLPELSAEEEAVYRRGRNAKSASAAKNATVIDYRMATGFEALVGYLYLMERFDRLAQLVGLGLERIGEFDKE